MKAATAKRMFIVMAISLVGVVFMLTASGCTEAERVSQNVSMEADNFNVYRRLTVTNLRSDTILMQITGKMSINVDTTDKQLEVLVEDDKGVFHKHFVDMSSPWSQYTIEDLGGAAVGKYKYELNFNPKMIQPFDIVTVN